MRTKKIYKFVLKTYGGQLENIEVEYQVSNEVFKLAQRIKKLVEQLAVFLKKREVQGFARIFFKGGRLVLDTCLRVCKITTSYVVLNQELSPQVIILTSITGGIIGFAMFWFKISATIISPPLLFSTFLIRSVIQQNLNYREYKEFKKLINEMLNDEELKKTIRAVFIDEAVPSPSRLDMKPFDSNKNSVPEFNFKSDQTFDEFIKAKMEKELGLVENSTQEQLENLFNRGKINTKSKGKTVFFKDFIEEIADLPDLNTKGPDEIIDAEIVKEPIKVKVTKEKL